ncbi:MAG: hypothetical protein FWD12_03485, partial [Alphaproteobacteria bacterium]|nr:hypothetical protein [Alphaproteobacteria bacterium]
VVLRGLVDAGFRHSVLLRDAAQYAHSFASNLPRLAGRHYTRMPVKVPGAFHPKLIFPTVKRKGAHTRRDQHDTRGGSDLIVS